MNKSAISVQEVSKIFTIHTESRSTIKERFVRGAAVGKRAFKALDSVSFDVPRGSTFGLIGHNGSGKSTMLKVLAGVYRPTSGRVMVDGRVSALLELGAGFHGELTGRENIYLNGAILGLTKKEINYRIDRIIEFADIGDFIDAPVKVYSSGMTVRLGFAIAVTLDPEILIVDEIIAVGDEDFQRKCFDYLFDLRRKGTTIALVTHSLDLASQLCDNAVWLDHGKARMLGDVNTVIDNYLSVVNEREFERRSVDKDLAKQNQGDYGLRQGSGEVRIKSMKLIDELGVETPFAYSAKTCRLRIEVECFEPVRDIEIGLGYITESGVFLAGPNSVASSHRSYSFDRGISYVDYVLESFDIQPGNYYVTGALVSSGHTYDYADREMPLAVRSETVVDQPGLVKLHGEWSEKYVVEG
ncbi:Teichoic acids export ATP-binding protein TagH [Arcanobacterium haemolyticum]|uniref:ABC transporter ATP-binding protein n=1 Tax=Arcanobacterium haemolyticum TaxID=28264 RepID=UPI000D811AD6|nr:ABC transporter ATP-binding protein [Arcanobacterium haemolyticum]SPT75722.1 Teichoic acids export ATP-binding protein TagH [Arcanobacterium haemolyticum]